MTKDARSFEGCRHTACTSPTHTPHHDWPGTKNASAPQPAAMRRLGKSVTTKITPPFVIHVYTLVSFYLARRSGAVGMILSPRIVIMRLGEDTRLRKRSPTEIPLHRVFIAFIQLWELRSAWTWEFEERFAGRCTRAARFHR